MSYLVQLRVVYFVVIGYFIAPLISLVMSQTKSYHGAVRVMTKQEENRPRQHRCRKPQGWRWRPRSPAQHLAALRCRPSCRVLGPHPCATNKKFIFLLQTFSQCSKIFSQQNETHVIIIVCWIPEFSENYWNYRIMWILSNCPTKLLCTCILSLECRCRPSLDINIHTR